jgi:hypothetical protein
MGSTSIRTTGETALAGNCSDRPFGSCLERTGDVLACWASIFAVGVFCHVCSLLRCGQTRRKVRNSIA